MANPHQKNTICKSEYRRQIQQYPQQRLQRYNTTRNKYNKLKSSDNQIINLYFIDMRSVMFGPSFRKA
eukprot:Pgem_evm1s15675